MTCGAKMHTNPDDSADRSVIPAPGLEGLKRFLIFRVEASSSGNPERRELADESDLQGEASKYADLMHLREGEAGVRYEVRSTHTGDLLHTTDSATDITTNVSGAAGNRVSGPDEPTIRKERHCEATRSPRQGQRQGPRQRPERATTPARTPMAIS